jgi:hypothetical protein
MDKPPEITMPKKACVINLMFECPEDAQAFAIKESIGNLIKDIPQKRFTFQIVET